MKKYNLSHAASLSHFVKNPTRTGFRKLNSGNVIQFVQYATEKQFNSALAKKDNDLKPCSGSRYDETTK